MRTVAGELEIFMGAVYSGMVLGVLYDFFRLIALPFYSKWVLGAFDALFYIIAGIFTAAAFLELTDGVLRLYVFLGMALGLSSYIFSVSYLLTALIEGRRLFCVKKR